MWFEKGNEKKDIKYVGEIDENGLPSGFGIITWGWGEKYAGKWKNGKRNGQGTIFLLDRKKYEEKWLVKEKHDHVLIPFPGEKMVKNCS